MPEPENASSEITELEKKGLQRASEFHRIGSAYALEHATKPSTIGIVLASSPIALLAWYVQLGQYSLSSIGTKV
jgi:microsomal epoxide hydrolase